MKQFLIITCAITVGIVASLQINQYLTGYQQFKRDQKFESYEQKYIQSTTVDTTTPNKVRDSTLAEELFMGTAK